MNSGYCIQRENRPVRSAAAGSEKNTRLDIVQSGHRLLFRRAVCREGDGVVHSVQIEVNLTFRVDYLATIAKGSVFPGCLHSFMQNGDDEPLVLVRLAFPLDFLAVSVYRPRSLAETLGSLFLFGGQVILGFFAVVNLFVIPLAISLFPQAS